MYSNIYNCKGLLLISFWALLNSVSHGLQRFAEQPEYTEVNPGQDALLSCKVIDKRGTCSWQKDNKPVGIYAKKYEWGGSPMGLHGMEMPHVGGDCSLWIRGAQLEYDDGLWECQVTASDFTTQDALTSQPVRLVVRVSPQRPRLEHEGVYIKPGDNVTVDSDGMATVKCVSHYGNPPPLLKWFLGDQEINPLHPQVNVTEPDNSRTWSASSVVQIPANRDRHGDVLKCVAIHESYAAKSESIEAKLNVKYAPTIRLVGEPQIDLEEGKDSLVLRCEADANPPASIVWRRSGRSEIASLQESLQIRPVSRRDAGVYTCQAQNSVGTSEEKHVTLDIKYPPRIVTAGPDRLTTAPLFTPAAFECVAEGNPPPIYKWVQRVSGGAAYVERGSESRLVIDNVTYVYQGDYECRATNFINGQERTVSSDPIQLQVVGAPQVLRLSPSLHTVSVRNGESAMLSLIVCADPRPRDVYWEWGSMRVEAGDSKDRFSVDDVHQDSTREDCYLATLHIRNAALHDSRPYYLVVENERGRDRHAVHLNVEGSFTDPMEMSYLLGIAGGCMAAMLILICLCIYAIRRRKCCFKNRGNFKSDEKDSEKADLKSRSDSMGGPQMDSIYTTPAGFPHHHHHHQFHPHGSPEAMKSTTLNSSSIRNPSVLYGTQHHRDLFTGNLGIPDVTTHVGSVIHTFESIARSHAEQPYEIQPIKEEISTNSRNSYRMANQRPPPPTTLHFRPHHTDEPNYTVSTVCPAVAYHQHSHDVFCTNGNHTTPIRCNQRDYRKNHFGINPNQEHCQRLHQYPDCQLLTKASSASTLAAATKKLSTNRTKNSLKNNGSSTVPCTTNSSKRNPNKIDEHQPLNANDILSQVNGGNYLNYGNEFNDNYGYDYDDENLLRGTIVSQSFIKNIGNNKGDKRVIDSNTDRIDQRLSQKYLKRDKNANQPLKVTVTAAGDDVPEKEEMKQMLRKSFRPKSRERAEI